MEQTNTLTVKQWQKLSPVALVYFVVHFFVRFIKDGLINIAPAFAVWLTQVENKLYWFGIGGSVITIGIALYAVLFFLNFRFKITDHEIILRKGILKKERVTLNFAKVQNVNLATPFYFAPFDLINCHFDAAGSAQQEVVLPGIKKGYAAELREAIFDYGKQHANEADHESQPITNEPTSPTLKLANKEVVKFGLFSGMLFLAAAALAPFSERLGGLLDQKFITPLTSIYGGFFDEPKLAALFAILTVSVVIIALFAVASLLGALVRFYNYELVVENNKIKRIAGLFERHQMSLSKNKIQSIEVKQNWVAKLFKRYVLNCKQINNSHANNVKKGQSLIVPVLTDEQVPEVLTLCWDKPLDFRHIPFAAVSKQFFYKTFVFFWLLPMSFIALFLFAIGVFKIALVMIPLIPIGLGLSYLRYKRYGYYFDGEQMFVRKGLIGVSYKVFKTFKVQQVHKIQTKMMAKRGLMTVRFQLASGRVTVPYLPKEAVTNITDTSIYLAQTSQQNWM